VPTLNTFLVYAASMTVLAGFATDNPPAGIAFHGRPYSEPELAYSHEPTTHHRVPTEAGPCVALILR
jgi:hypothetical protein